MSALLKVQGLGVQLRRPRMMMLQDLSFSLEPGQSLVILGQCGSGKSTLCRALMDLLTPRQFALTGSACFEGQELVGMPPVKRRSLCPRMAFIPQNPMTALNPSAKIGRQMMETMALHTRLPQAQRLQRVDQALQEAGLQDAAGIRASYPFMLSGGMLQRVTIAMALMTGARLVVADEPTTALDALHRSGVIEALKGLRQSGAAVLMVTHDFPTALQLGGQLLVMREGRILEQGDMAALLAAPRHPYTRALIEASCLKRKESSC